MWDLAHKENWQLILRESRIVEKLVDPKPTEYDYTYKAIRPIYANPNSHILLVGTYSQSAKPHWFLGARVSQYLYVSPSTNSHLISGVQSSDIKKVGLNRLTLVKFDNYNIVPYSLQIEIPYWLEDIYVEVWEYDGIVEDSTQQFDFEEILERLERIESKLNSPQTLINNYSTQFDNPDSSASLGII